MLTLCTINLVCNTLVLVALFWFVTIHNDEHEDTEMELRNLQRKYERLVGIVED
jgi:hypothetical protein